MYNCNLMLSIYTTPGLIDQIAGIIRTENRLEELIQVYNSLERSPVASDLSLIVDSHGMRLPIDWENLGPPYLLPATIPFNSDNLLGLIFTKLGNGEKAWSYLQQNQSLLFEIGISSRLRHGYQIDLAEWHPLSPGPGSGAIFEQYRNLHNAAVVRHYGFITEDIPLETIRHYYEQALDQCPHNEYAAFTGRQYATLLTDTGELEAAAQLLEDKLQNQLSSDARMALKTALTQVWMKQLTVPYDPVLLANLKDTLWEVLQYNEKHERQAEIGLLLLDTAHIANISESFAEALGYVTRAARIFESEGLEELAGQAQLRKGTLLYTWAQQGNPQFYKPAIEAYQQALKVFRQELTPDVFADIHHHLAVLYSEMPSESKKKGIWAGIASSSFQEALNYYNRADFPYEYGMICNNYGNALTKFPQAVHSDNYEKALFYYQEALAVRTTAFPYERAISLLNFLEASWKVSNDQDELNEERFAEMLAKAREVKTLPVDAGMWQEAEKHLELLAELRGIVRAE